MSIAGRIARLPLGLPEVEVLRNVVVDQHNREQHREILDREPERSSRERVTVVAIQSPRIPDEDRVQNERTDEVGDASHLRRERHHRDRRQHPTTW